MDEQVDYRVLFESWHFGRSTSGRANKSKGSNVMAMFTN